MRTSARLAAVGDGWGSTHAISSTSARLPSSPSCFAHSGALFQSSAFALLVRIIMNKNETLAEIAVNAARFALSLIARAKTHLIHR